jgi:hypothetical protein
MNLFIFLHVSQFFRALSRHLGHFSRRFHAIFLVPIVCRPSHPARNKKTSTTSSQILPPISVQGIPATYVHPIHPMSPKPGPPTRSDFSRGGWKPCPDTRRCSRGGWIAENDQQRVATRSTDHARSPNHAVYLPPTRHFFNPCCKHSTSSQSTLGPPLRGAWVALGPRLGLPRATQSQTQSPAERHRQRVATPKCENPASAGLNHSCGTVVLGCAFN